MTIKEAISARHMVRTYTDKPIPDDIVIKLNERIALMNDAHGVQMKLITGENAPIRRIRPQTGAFSPVMSFVVEEVNLEELSLVADHALMNTLAASTGGAMLPADSLAQLPSLLAARDDIRSVIYSHTRYTDLLNLPWVLLLIILLLTLEWSLRKYFLN